MIEIAPSQIYTIRDVAEYFKCSTRKVHRLIATGQLRGFKIGNQRRFKGEEILQFIERQGNGLRDEPLIAEAVQPDRLYMQREVAAILQLPSDEVTSLLRAGRLPGFRVGLEWRCWGRDLLVLMHKRDSMQHPQDEPQATPMLPPDERGDTDGAQSLDESAA